MQLYNEEILDLFDGARDPESRSRKSNIKIHEDASGSIYTTGVTSRLVHSEEEVGACVCIGVCNILYVRHLQLPSLHFISLFQYVVFLYSTCYEAVSLQLTFPGLKVIKVYKSLNVSKLFNPLS